MLRVAGYVGVASVGSIGGSSGQLGASRERFVWCVEMLVCWVIDGEDAV